MARVWKHLGIITRQAVRRGTFTSVKNLITAIETYIDPRNDRCEPFTWTKDADTILAKAVHSKKRNTRRVSYTPLGLAPKPQHRP